MSQSPYVAASPAKLAEILRLAEARLSAQLTLGVAADQRAMTMASFLAALDAGVIAVWTALKLAHSIPIALMVTGFAISALLAAWSAQPVHWCVVGNEPKNWIDDIAEGDTLHNGYAAMAEHYDSMIAKNDSAIADNARLMRAAFFVMIATLILSGVAAFFRG
jgi:hypothetical protein